MEVSQNLGYHFGGPSSKDYSIWGLHWIPLTLGNCHMNTATQTALNSNRFLLLPEATDRLKTDILNLALLHSRENG